MLAKFMVRIVVYEPHSRLLWRPEHAGVLSITLCASAQRLLSLEGILVSTLLGFLCCPVTHAKAGNNEIALSQVQIYKSPSTARKSEKFKVAVNNQTAFVGQLPAEEGDLYIKFPGCESLSYHCARFAFDGQAKVRFTVDGADNFRLRPASAGIQTRVDGSTIEFTMTEPRNLMLDLGSAWLSIFPPAHTKPARCGFIAT